MPLTRLFLATSAGLLAAGAAFASPEQDMAQRLKAMYPSQRFDAVRAAPLPGFFEVQMGKSMAYVESSGRYFLFGGLYDMQNRKDLTAERRAELEKVDVKTLPANLAIQFGNGPRLVYVFSDPNCGYCKQLETTLAQMPDVTVMLYPTPILGESSRDLVQRLWCSPDRAQAWRAWMTKSQQPAKAGAEGTSCAAPLEAMQSLAEKVGVQGTPTLVSADGRRTAGALSLADLQGWIGPAMAASAASRSMKTVAVQAAPAAR